MVINALRKDLKGFSDKKRALDSQRYFKTGKGEYGEGDIFVGLTLIQAHIISKRYKDLSFVGIQTLLDSKIHEERTIALAILIDQFQKEKDKIKQKEIFDFYIKNTKNINNWDLVDVSAPKIVGPYLMDKPKDILFKLAKSKSIWERRIAMLSTLYYIKNGDYEISLKIAEMLVLDKEDLIQKAVGWMLREIGKKDLRIEEKFLKKHYMKMGRTALRYAIEKFPENLRQKYLLGKI
ncbi:MAG: DNA alkylation repair protein [Patescibacteria group bacterium]|nr:DNA alkylation repair protein [Patescibacteria group bacterium]